MRTADTPPDLSSERSKAWKVDIDAMRASVDYPMPPRELAVAMWIVYAPWAHPVWHSYAISCISLKPLDGASPAIIMLPDATHEIIVGALNPSAETHIDRIPAYLEPLNFVGQFIAESDQTAAAQVQDTVQEIINCTLSPDTDFVLEWIKRYGDSCLRRMA